MKAKDISLCGKEFILTNEDFSETYNTVIIYEYQNGKPVAIASGTTLREACMNWIKSDYAIDNLVVNMELWAKEHKIDLGSIGYAVAIDKFIETLDGYELFAFMAYDSHHAYIDWSKVEEAY